MNVKELYEKFSSRMPESDREEWDNDGIMCSADLSREISRALVTLDVTEDVIDYAIKSDIDLIVSHHPLIFKPLTSVSEDNHVARKVMKLIDSGISVFSFHTRADKAAGGVNDTLCDLLGIFDAEIFGEGDIGRVGNLGEECSLEDFVYRIKQTLGSDMVRYADGFNSVSRVAVVGGDGKDFVRDALLSGADTYLSGRLSYNVMEEAGELGINLIEAGHYYTEQPVTDFFQEMLVEFDPNMYVEIVHSNVIKTY